jgi:type IV pilus assembly protein PilC
MTVKHRFRRAIRRMNEEIRRGASFSSMVAQEKKIFSSEMSKLIASGEQSGNLDSILERLAESIERSKELKRQLIAALFYPLFVLLAAIGVVVFLVVGVIPRFATFLTARNATLPASTQVLLDISEWARNWGGVVGGALGVAIFCILAAYTTRRGKKVVDRCLLAVPVVGSAVLFASMAQAGWSLSMLLKSGVTALESLRITSGVIKNLAVGDCFENAAEGLLTGRSLSKTLEQPLIPLMVRHMAALGESSGQLDSVMHDVGEYYQKELAAKVKLIAVMIEPMLILVVGGMVGFVYFSFFQAVMAVSKGGM